MSYEIIRRQANGLARTSWQSRRQVQAVYERGVEAVAKVEAMAYLAHVGMSYAAMLSNLEAEAITRHPHAEPRFRAIADTFTGGVCVALTELAL